MFSILHALFHPTRLPRTKWCEGHRAYLASEKFGSPDNKKCIDCMMKDIRDQVGPNCGISMCW